jgi:hypothetical protein
MPNSSDEPAKKMLAAGFLAAFPVNYIMIGKGVRHIH